MASIVRTLRKKKKMSLETLAEKTGYSTTFLSRVERGERNLSNESRPVVAQVLGVPEADLLAVEEINHEDVQGEASVNPLLKESPDFGHRAVPDREAATVEAKLTLINKITHMTGQQISLLEPYVDALMGTPSTRGARPQKRGRTS